MDIEYLKTGVGRYLGLALTEVARRRPDRPIEFLAYYLISLHEKELIEQQERQKAAAAAQESKDGSKSMSIVDAVHATLFGILGECSRSKSDGVIDNEFSRQTSILIGTDAQLDPLIIQRLSKPDVLQSVVRADSVAPNVFSLSDVPKEEERSEPVPEAEPVPAEEPVPIPEASDTTEN